MVFERCVTAYSTAGDFDVWHRVVQAVTNNEELQQHAAEKVFKVCEFCV